MARKVRSEAIHSIVSEVSADLALDYWQAHAQALRQVQTNVGAEGPHRGEAGGARSDAASAGLDPTSTITQ